MKLVGFHGTCMSAAKSIVANGFEDKNTKMRAGPGAYLWMGDSALEQRAIALSQAWWAQRVKAGDYSAQSDAKCAVVRAEFDVDVSEYMDLDQRAHHLGLVVFLERYKQLGKVFKDEAALYDAYIHMQHGEYRKRNTDLKVVKALMPAPSRFTWDMTPYLTKNVTAYIVQPNALALVGPGALTIVK